MHSAIVALLVSLAATLLLMRGSARSASLAGQGRAAPISGLAALMGMCAGWLAMVISPTAQPQTPLSDLLWALPGAALPAFLGGMTVDFWRPLSLRTRLVITAGAAGLFAVVLARHGQTDHAVPWLLAGFGVAVAVFVTALTHAMAVVDQRNGAAATCVLLIQASLAYVAHEVGDFELMQHTLVVAGAVTGLSFFSFQANLASLGRSGCALLGYVTAALAVLLVARNPQVSTWLPVLLCAHPVLEAAWAWQRRRQGRTPGAGPSLLYLRLVRWASGNLPDRRQVARDTSVAPHLWMLCIVGIAPALMWWQDDTALLFALLVRVGVQVAAVKLLSGVPTAARSSAAEAAPVET